MGEREREGETTFEERGTGASAMTTGNDIKQNPPKR